ncbi:MAG: TatD family hydrolase [bacterium]
MIDTHCHIISKFGYTDVDSIIKNAYMNGVNKFICIGCDFEDIEQTLNLNILYPGIVYSAIGLHPETVKEDSNIEELWFSFLNIFNNNKENIFAIGECGLDYHYSNSEEIHNKQKLLFRKHIELCIEENKPLIIHTRDAWEDTFSILNDYNLKSKLTKHHIISNDSAEKGFPEMDIDLTCGIVHSFTAGPEEALKCIELGFKLGINGVITFQTKTADPIREAVLNVDLENIVLETDSPFLSPEPYRGKVNEPARIKDIAKYILRLKGN